MSTKSLINSLIKRILNIFFAGLGARVITRSDFSSNGLKPFMIQYFLHQSNGVLHIGAHEGQEAKFYASLNKLVIWIEANPTVFDTLARNIEWLPNQSAFNFLLASEDQTDREFHFTNNNQHSASMFPLSQNHSWAGLVNTESINIDAVRLDSKFNVMDLAEYDFWVVDTQGAELEVLKGTGNLLEECCMYLLVEISQTEFYQGGAKYKEVEEFLRKKMFFPMFSPSYSHEEVLFLNISKARQD
jgi:FkbM family methyltransferase